ncbi:MAG: hypothetical protein UU37_C0003G0040 [Candidatus Gottesmanbacteria bacterium GW2011_GWA2_41_12]|uniref:Resolvase helix-turn-helix domain protein n=2 Tax=Candidatus Gottesmaniibacteriota TaxID=1752720 RepID=A0A0G0ULQ3_9BACT|nr:MAG: hypothetical protein UT63_C0025G0014 [Candidatus Gottesmanbacteria bacterium GW2011_GWC2_39_8]KKR88466.1 MAG: hypothetical protein UU37_C0003G0040 [Candidatus Gottesmanbacteria bacterium GW2011_GWA2_41_12]
MLIIVTYDLYLFMTKIKLKKEAIGLRKQGFGIKTISYKLNVSSSTVNRWCKDILLTPEQIFELKRRSRDPYYGKRLKYINSLKQKRLDAIDKLRGKGIKEVGKLTKRDVFIAGIVMYWAEGFKKDRRLGFANSDPAMIKFFLNWLINNCKVPKKDIRLRVGLNISHKDRVHEVEKFWSNVSGISINQFQKPFFQKFIWKKAFPEPNKYFGVLRIRANKQLDLFRKISGLIDGLKLYTAG